MTHEIDKPIVVHRHRPNHMQKLKDAQLMYINGKFTALMAAMQKIIDLEGNTEARQIASQAVTDADK